MAGRRIRVLDVREVVRRLRLGESDRQVAQGVGVNRRTVVKYRKRALADGWLDRPELPAPEEIASRLTALPPRSPRAVSSAEPHRELIVDLRRKGVEVQAIWQILRDRHAYRRSYNSVLRFVHCQEPETPEACARTESAPGEEAHVDTGRPHDRAVRSARPFWSRCSDFISSRFRSCPHPSRE